MKGQRIGLEIIQEQPGLAASWGACVLLCNQASLTSTFEPAYRVCHQVLGERLRAIMGPQHGFWGTAQDNMIETAHERLAGLDIPVYSLYSETREPTAEMLAGIDTILVDMQLVGCRIYTFKATILGCLRAAQRLGKRVVILDRPNPLGGELVEGRCPDGDMLSFVAPDFLPMRHGLTPGEAARFFNQRIGAQLEVVALQGWRARENFRSLARPWVPTSPNLPTLTPVFIYPGMVLFEGCNVSEGRGTGLPFQLIGAPFLKKGLSHLKERVYQLYPRLAGVFLREACFQPTSGKWQGQVCYGLQIHPLEPERIASFSLGLALLRAMWELAPDEFAWKKPPYEYEYTKLPMEVIMGSSQFLRYFEAFNLVDPFWHEGVGTYLSRCAPFLLYPREMKLFA